MFHVSPWWDNNVDLNLNLSRPDLFHLSLWLSPPTSRCLLFSLLVPGVFIPVFPVSLCQFILFCQVNQRFSKLLFFTSLCFWFWSFPVLAPYPPAWPLFLSWPQACLSPGTVWTLTWFMNSHLSPTCLLPTPFGIINIGVQPSASCVCFWVSPCALIESEMTIQAGGRVGIAGEPVPSYIFRGSVQTHAVSWVHLLISSTLTTQSEYHV